MLAKKRLEIPAQPVLGWTCAVVMCFICWAGLVVDLVLYTGVVDLILIGIVLISLWYGLRASMRLAFGWSVEF